MNIYEFISCSSRGKEFFLKKGLDDRMATSYSVIGAGIMAAFGTIPPVFREYLAFEMSRVKKQTERQQAVGVFFEDLLAYKYAGILRDQFWTVDKGFIYLYFHGLYTVWSREYRRIHGNEPIKSDAIRNYLRNEPGFVEMSVNHRMKSRQNRCVMFSYDEAPDFIRDLFDGETVTAPSVTVTDVKKEVKQRNDLK